MWPRRACACSRSHPKASGTVTALPTHAGVRNHARVQHACERALGDPRIRAVVIRSSSATARSGSASRNSNAPVVVRRQRIRGSTLAGPGTRQQSAVLRPRPMDFATHHHGHRNHLHLFFIMQMDTMDVDRIICPAFIPSRNRYFSFLESSSPSAIAVFEVLPFQ